MARIVVDVNDELDIEFRKVILDKFGTKKASLRDAVEEAIKLWLEKEKKC